MSCLQILETKLKKRIKGMKRKINALLIIMMLLAAVQIGVWAKPNQNIVEVASQDPQFSTLVTALQAAGLVETLQGEGPFTVFAPTNDAFAKLPAETLANLLKPENKQMLVDILTYHVASGKLTAKDVIKLDGKDIIMVNNKPAKIAVKDGKVFVDDAQITQTDIMTKNGIIHIIDTVILP